SKIRSGRRTASRRNACAPSVAGRISKPSFPSIVPRTWMLDSWSSTTRRQSLAVVSVIGSDMAGGFRFNGHDYSGKFGKLPLQVAHGVGFGMRGQSFSVSGQRRALGAPGELTQFLGKSLGVIDGERLAEKAPLFGLQGAEFRREHIPIPGFSGRGDGRGLGGRGRFGRYLAGRFQRARRSSKELRQFLVKHAPGERFANIAVEVMPQVLFVIHLAGGGDGDDRE